jgi:threonine dehydrogenase-like Zn-dependent dehydrogenase
MTVKDVCPTDDNDRFLFDHIMPLEQAPEGYTLFEQRKTQKVVFTLSHE